MEFYRSNEIVDRQESPEQQICSASLDYIQQNRSKIVELSNRYKTLIEMTFAP